MMKKVIVLLAVGLIAVCGLVSYVYMTNRTVIQVLAIDREIGPDWIELVPNSPLSDSRMVAELVLIVADFKLDPSERLPSGQFRLPNGQVAQPQIEAVDESGNIVAIRHSGFTMSGRDSIRFIPEPELKNAKLVKIRLRSDVPFRCEKIVWSNRNMK